MEAAPHGTVICNSATVSRNLSGNSKMPNERIEAGNAEAIQRSVQGGGPPLLHGKVRFAVSKPQGYVWVSL